MFQLPTLYEIVIMIPGVLIGFTFHEFAHAIVATWFGDDTPRAQGRLSISPMDHLDPWGTILLLIGGFGWAKPVQVNTARLRPRILGDICVSLAGVTMNFLIALIFFALAVLGENGLLFGYHNPILNEVLWQTYWVNLILVGFNLIPLPPLDGFHVARYLFPPSMGHVVNALYRIGPMLLMLLFFTRITRYFMPPVYDALEGAVAGIVMPVLRAIFA